MANTIFRLNKIALSKSSFRVPYIGFKASRDLDLSLDVKSKQKNEYYLVDVSIKLNDLKEQEDFILEATMTGQFSIEETNGGEGNTLSQENFLNINAPAIIYPYLRQHIRNITLDAGFTEPVLIPIINFVKFYNDRRIEN